MENLQPSRPHCCHCGLPIQKGEAVWAGDPEERPWHYGCAEQARLTTPCRPLPVPPPGTF